MIAKQLAAYKAWCKANNKKPQEYKNLKNYILDIELWKGAAKAKNQAFETYLYETIEHYKELTKHGHSGYNKPLQELEAIYKGFR